MGVIILGLNEFYRMTLPHRKSDGYIASGCGIIIPLSLFSDDRFVTLCALTTLVIFFSLLMLFRIREIKEAARDSALILMGILYIPCLLSHLILLRTLPSGTEWILLLLVIVMCGDSAAFYTGSAFGKRKLYPQVSPKKSVEGSAGGLAGSVVGAFIVKYTFFPLLGIVDCIAVALLLGVLGQLGDLFESLIKRSCNVKDSGAIFPGHGGILDRLDSILFAAPAGFYYAYFVFTP